MASPETLPAEGITIGGISAHFEKILGASISKEITSRIADEGLEEMKEWSTRPPTSSRLRITAEMTGRTPTGHSAASS